MAGKCRSKCDNQLNVADELWMTARNAKISPDVISSVYSFSNFTYVIVVVTYAILAYNVNVLRFK